MTNNKLYEQLIKGISKQIKNTLNEIEIPKWRQVPGTRYIWHGSWADPEVVYRGYHLNVNDLEDYLYDCFKEIIDEEGVEPGAYIFELTGEILDNTSEEICYEKWLEYQGTSYLLDALEVTISNYLNIYGRKTKNFYNSDELE